MAAAGRVPGIEPASKLGKHLLGRGDLLLEESPHLQAGTRSGASKRDDPADFAQRESQPPGMGHEDKDGQHIVRVETIAGRCSTRRRQDAPRLIDLKRLAAKSAPGCYLANPQPLCHVPELTAGPYGTGQARNFSFDTETPTPRTVYLHRLERAW